MTDRVPFVGRVEERERFARAARDAARGHPWLVTIEGPAGSGKSALLRAGVEALGGDVVVERAVGDELALDEPMGLLGQLVDVEGCPPFTAAVRLIDHLARIQGDGALAVVVIEDLQWADAASLAAVVTALRRLDHDRVLVAVTVRDDEAPRDERWVRLCADPDRCRRIVVPPLGDADCAALAAAVGADLEPWAAARLARHTAGNALYVRTLLDELTPSQLASPDPTLPVPRSLRSIVTAQVAGLPGPVASACEALAVLGGRAPLGLVEQVSGMADLGDLLAATGAGSLLEVADGAGAPELAFRHPLQEAAVYGDLPPGRRRQLHAAAARALPAPEALRHRALAADPADSTLDADLVAAAERARADGRGALAARYLRWAADVDDDALRVRRSLQASLALLEAGEVGEARERCPASASTADQQLLDLVRGMLAAATGDVVTGEHLLRSAARGDDPARAADALIQLGYLCTALARGADAVEATRQVEALVPAGSDEADVAGVLHAIGISQQQGARAGLVDLEARFPEGRALAPSIDALVIGTRGMFELYAGHHRAAVASLHAFIERSHRGVQTVHLARAETLLALGLIAGGEWDEAAAHARTAVDLAAEEGLLLVLAQARAVVAMALAPGAASDTAPGYVDEARRSADRAGTAEADVWARLAAACVAAAGGFPDAVVSALEPLVHGPRDDAAPMFAPLWLPRLVGALIDLDRLAEAARHLEMLELARRRNDELAMVVALAQARLAAARGDTEPALAAFERAAELVTPDTAVLDRFALHRHHGDLLVSAGRLEAGRDQLFAAERLVARLGGGPFVEGIRADLEAAGAAPGTEAPSVVAGPGLTARERDVVALVRQGYTNREVADTLFVSVKAVEYHMGNIFSKLGIRSRRELQPRRR